MLKVYHSIQFGIVSFAVAPLCFVTTVALYRFITIIYNCFITFACNCFIATVYNCSITN